MSQQRSVDAGTAWPTQPWPLVTVVMPVRNEAAFIARSLGAVLAQDYPADRMEIIVADGMSTDATRAIARAFQRNHGNLRLVDNPGRIVSPGLNEAIRCSNGEIIVRVDGHCEIDPSYVRRCVEYLRDEGVHGVGGLFRAEGQSRHARAIAAAMSSRFGVGNATFRLLPEQPMLVDTIPLPAYPRSVIERTGWFDEELVRDQDDEYNHRIRKAGGRLLLAPDIRARYFARPSLRALWSQYFQYGYWKVRVLQKHPRQMRPRQFVPPAFVATLLAASLLSPISRAARLALALVMGTYVSASFFASGQVARGGGADRPVLMAAFAALHLSWGCGFLLGLVQFWSRWGNHRAAQQPLPRKRGPLREG